MSCTCGTCASCCCGDSPELTYSGATAGATDTTEITVNGHPIWMIQQASDLALFDVGGTGAGSGIWAKWAICDGQAHTATSGATVTTPDLRNMFIVGAGDEYAVDDTGGEKEHTLTTPEMPGHNHAITDSGHTHTATQAAHAHTLTDGGHTHSLTDPGHTHALTIAADGSHTHDVVIETGTYGNTTGNPNTVVYVPGPTATDDTETTDSEANHSHSGSSVASATTGATVASATTGITMANATPAITVNSATTGVVVGQTGGGDPHENRPPYYALMYIMHIG